MVNRFVGINTGTSFMIQIISTYRTLRLSNLDILYKGNAIVKVGKSVLYLFVLHRGCFLPLCRVFNYKLGIHSPVPVF